MRLKLFTSPSNNCIPSGPSIFFFDESCLSILYNTYTNCCCAYTNDGWFVWWWDFELFVSLDRNKKKYKENWQPFNEREMDKLKKFMYDTKCLIRLRIANCYKNMLPHMHKSSTTHRNMHIFICNGKNVYAYLFQIVLQNMCWGEFEWHRHTRYVRRNKKQQQQ